MTTSTPAAAVAGKSHSSQGSRGLDWLKTREGKIAAGAAAAVLVVVMALRKKAGGGGGFTAQPQAATSDGTMQDRLDQLTGTGGTLSELGAQVSGIAGSLDQLRDLLDAQNPANKTPAAKAPPGGVTGLRASSNWQDINWLWSPVQGASKYLVELIQGRDTVVKRQTVTGTSWRVGGGLQADKPYRVRVTPIGPTGASGPAASYTYRTQPKR